MKTMKNKRHEAILRIITENIVETQDELQKYLEEAGFTVTQSTVSRDIKQLRVTKTHDSHGNCRYISRISQADIKSDDHQKYIDVFSNCVRSIDYAMNDVVIKCYPGMASSACLTIDSIYKDMIVGSLAGDDTIFVITRSEDSAKELVSKLNGLI